MVRTYVQRIRLSTLFKKFQEIRKTRGLIYYICQFKREEKKHAKQGTKEEWILAPNQDRSRFTIR